jgi:uroporphyrinogen-III decarboxylase
MTTEQRVLAALRCERPDRVPVFLYLNPYVESWHTRDPSYKAVLDACKEYADIIYDWGCPSGFFHSTAALKTETRDLPDGRKEHIRHTPAGPISMVTRANWRGAGTVKRWVTTPEDAERLLSIPYEPSRPSLSEFFETKERLEGKCVAQVTFPDPICVAEYVDEAVLAVWTLEHRDLIRRMLDAVVERLLDALKYCLESGVGPIYYFNGPEFALPPLMSPRDFEEFVVQYDTRLFELVHSYPDRYVIVHSHGRVGRFLERFAAMGMDGLNVLEPPPIGDTVLSDAKKRIGGRVCLIGNIQYDDLARGSEEKVERLVADAMAQGAPGGGFILSPCASPYERPLPEKAARNFIHYLRMGREYGRY